MQKSFDYNNSAIFYTVSGSGIPVVLLHGFGEDSRIWKKQEPVLSKKFKTIIPDLPGSGKSKILSKENAGIEDYADCIKALLDFEKIDACILLGHSMGGYITLAFAEKFPERLIAFGLVQATAFADNEEKKTTRKKGIEMMDEYGAEPFLKNTIPNLFSKKFKAEHPGEVEALIEQGKSFDKKALIQYYNAMMNRPDRTGVLANSKVPVLFIVGTEDVAAPLKDMLEQVHLPKVSHIHIIEGIGHMSMMEESEKLNDHLMQFLESVTIN